MSFLLHNVLFVFFFVYIDNDGCGNDNGITEMVMMAVATSGGENSGNKGNGVQ